MDWPPQGLLLVEPDMARRCGWVYEVCGGLLACGATTGHSGPWHGVVGDTFTHIWREDDEDAMDRNAARPVHTYVSTACHHSLCDQCRETCKWCSEKCVCICHGTHHG